MKINKGPIYKSLIVLKENTKTNNQTNSDLYPLVLKIYSKKIINLEESNFTKYYNKLLEIKRNFHKKTNVIPILDTKKIEDELIIIRQYMPFNLKEAMLKIPYLSIIEKKFICFQILYSLNQIHLKNICHGDIKPENILLGSKLTTFLSDISIFKPIYIKNNDIKIFNNFFSNTGACYLAPERFKDNDFFDGNYSTCTIEMDYFSVGVVIAEIFLGENLFDITQIIRYKKDKYDIKSVLRKINDAQLQNLIEQMLSKSPHNRTKDSKDYLTFFAKNLCPNPLSGFLIHLNSMIIYNEYYNNDLLIAFIGKHFKQIWKILFYENNKNIIVPEIIHKPNKIILNYLNKETPIYQVGIENFTLLFKPSKDESEINIQLLEKGNNTNSNECNFIILRYLINCLNNVKYPSSIILALELIEKFSTKIDDNTKIQLIIPYLISLFSIDNTLIKNSCYNTIINILSSVQEYILNQLDLHSYTYYIFENITKLYYNSDLEVKITIINSINKLIEFQEKFSYFSLSSQRKTKNLITETNINEFQSIICQSQIYFQNQTINKDNNEYGKIDIKGYENELKQFKEMLRAIIDDIFQGDNEILQLVLLKKYNEILFFYGHLESNDFLNYLMILFNRNNLELKKEILKIFPNIIMMFGDNIFFSYYLPCIERILMKKNNEELNLQLIHSMNTISKANLIQKKSKIDLFQKSFIFLFHPNFEIRKEMIDFGVELIKNLPNKLIYSYLRDDIKKFNHFPFLNISIDIIKNISEKFIHRDEFILYKKYIDWDFDENNLKILPHLVNQTKDLKKK